jgi:hypothetical protein
MQRLNIDQHSFGGRMHFLRFENPVTWKGLEQAGLAYDSTLGYPEHIGFRCGTCRQFPVYHLTERRKLNLVERPLLVMDQTLLNCKYMNLTYEEALKKCSYLANICRKYNGNFTLLWHNSHLVSSKERELYKQIVKASCKGGE